MENASKALIIAGAILLAILLITIGILIFNSIKETTNQATPTSDLMSLEGAVATIDMQFSKYNGIQNTETIVEMIQEVIEYNSKDINGYYVAGDDTTKLLRKIAVGITTESSRSTTDPTGKEGNTLEAYISDIKNYSNKYNINEFIVKTEKKLGDNSGNKSYIYMIYIKPNK